MHLQKSETNFLPSPFFSTEMHQVDGEPRGTGTGTHKHVARDLAANEALEYLEKQEV